MKQHCDVITRGLVHFSHNFERMQTFGFSMFFVFALLHDEHSNLLIRNIRWVIRKHENDASIL